MPIHFRCAHCEKLLGIARRKAGTIVNCPQCGQPLIVPTPDDEPFTPVPDPGASTNHSEMRTAHGNLDHKPKKTSDRSNRLFEEADLDRFLNLSVNKSQNSENPGGTFQPKSMLPDIGFNSNGLPVPLPAPIPAPLPVIVPTAGGLSVGKILALVLIVFCLVIGAFVGGYFLGKTPKGSVAVPTAE